MKPLLTIIITCYNQQEFIEKAIVSCVHSVHQNLIEIIVVDDCSVDESYSYILNLQKQYKNISLYQIQNNSGSPSLPRNIGIDKAQGQWITFLDADDFLDIDILLTTLQTNNNNFDLIQSWLYICRENKIFQANKIIRTYNNILKDIISSSSSRIDFLIKTSMLQDNNIRFCTSLHVGEDTVFKAQIFTTINSNKILYIDDAPWYFYNKHSQQTTNNISSRGLNSQIQAWQQTKEILDKIGIDYYSLRLHVGVKNTLQTLIQVKSNINKEIFNIFCEFIISINNIIFNKLNLSDRFYDIYKTILNKNFIEFCNAIKPRLLIIGYDLKFIKPAITALAQHYKIEVDEWKNHITPPNQELSLKKLHNCDIIFSEWLAGNAVFASTYKLATQKLFIRYHGYEINREFASQVNWQNIDKCFVVSMLYQEALIRKFNLDRFKVKLLANFIAPEIKQAFVSDKFNFTLAIVGILPKRKGLIKALHLLNNLVTQDSRFKLKIIGKSIDELPWLRNNLEELNYYENCEHYIQENNLSQHIERIQHSPQDKIYHGIDFILSTSQFETFHLAPMEGAFCGAVPCVLNWQGSEFIYPQEFIFENIEHIQAFILKLSQD